MKVELSPKDKKLVISILKKTFIGLGLFTIVGFLLFFAFDKQLNHIADLIVEHLGFWGILLTTFILDIFVTPIPPDIFLIIIKKSSFAEKWYIYVLFFGLASALGGFIGSYIGRWLSKMPWATYINDWVKENSTFVRKFGFWAIILGAFTPIPFALTCWTAGFIKMRPHKIFLACLTRVPRHFLFYFIIAYSDKFSQLF